MPCGANGVEGTGVSLPMNSSDPRRIKVKFSLSYNLRVAIFVDLLNAKI